MIRSRVIAGTDRPSIGVGIDGIVTETRDVGLCGGMAIGHPLGTKHRYSGSQSTTGAINGRLVGLALDIHEAGQRSRRENAEDNDHHDEFDEGETSLFVHLRLLNPGALNEALPDGTLRLHTLDNDSRLNFFRERRDDSTQRRA